MFSSMHHAVHACTPLAHRLGPQRQTTVYVMEAVQCHLVHEYKHRNRPSTLSWKHRQTSTDL